MSAVRRPAPRLSSLVPKLPEAFQEEEVLLAVAVSRMLLGVVAMEVESENAAITPLALSVTRLTVAMTWIMSHIPIPEVLLLNFRLAMPLTNIRLSSFRQCEILLSAELRFLTFQRMIASTQSEMQIYFYASSQSALSPKSPILQSVYIISRDVSQCSSFTFL